MSSFWFVAFLAVLLTFGTWVFTRAGFMADHFGDRSFYIWFVGLLMPVGRHTADALLNGWDKVVENAAVSLASWGIGTVWVIGCYMIGFLLGKNRRNRKPRIIPMK